MSSFNLALRIAKEVFYKTTGTGRLLHWNGSVISCARIALNKHHFLHSKLQLSDFRTDRHSRHYSTIPNETVQKTKENTTQEDEEAKEKREKSWKRMKLTLILMGSCFCVSSIYSFYVLDGSLPLSSSFLKDGSSKNTTSPEYLFLTARSPDRDENDNDIEDEFSSLPVFQQWCKRFVAQIRHLTKIIQEPSQQKLLPDPLTYPYVQPPYTVVLELTDLLVHPDWTYSTGWRFKKRPHIDQFLEQIGPPIFELVVFTAEQGITVFPILNQLDKNGVIVYRLVRDSTDFVDGHHVKNLDWLNRDLSKVIVVDWNSESVKFHPNNALILPRWKGNDDDHTLIDLATFLKTIAFNKVDDVRDVLEYYRGYDDPMEVFREKQRKLTEQIEEQERLEQAKKQNPPLTQRFSKSYVSFQR